MLKKYVLSNIALRPQDFHQAKDCNLQYIPRLIIIRKQNIAFLVLLQIHYKTIFSKTL